MREGCCGGLSVEPHRPNTILVGRKPPINYVMAALKLLNDEGVEEVVIKARGRNICTAVEAAEMLKNLFLKEKAVIKDVNIYREELVDEQGRQRSVTAIEIVVSKK